MEEIVRRLGLKVLGVCGTCGETLVLDGRAIRNHTNPKGNRCSGSGYSPLSRHYRIEDESQAHEVAKIIAADDEVCLSGRDYHTLNCRDGQDCAEERQRLAKALANYILRS